MRAKSIWQEAVIFYLGGMFYLGVELLWRQWTHGSMFLLGAACFYLVGNLDRERRDMPVLLQMIFGTMIVTVLEFFTGVIVNRMLLLNVWDYSHLPYNLFGQVCVNFSLLWFPLCGIAILLDDWLRYVLFQTPIPKYRWI